MTIRLLIALPCLLLLSQPVLAKELEAYKAKPVELNQRVDAEEKGTAEDTLSGLFGIWHTKVPGGVWQSPSQVPGYDVLHIAPGVLSGDLTISPNGHYAWNSYGGKTGRWEKGNSKDYPIVLIDTVENKKWRIGFNKRGKGIFIWDGFVHYTGTR